ncbi:MAG: toxin-antitoxin system YwqK family antitoxin [Flavobacteriales bacterium]
MKTTIPPLFLLLLMIGTGCQQPCTKISKQSTYAGDTIYTYKTYPNCADTLTYTQRQIKADSSVVSEGEMLDGKKDALWVYYGYSKREAEYKNGIEIVKRSYDKEGRLSEESVLGEDSLYLEKTFYDNGQVRLERFVNSDGFLTGHGFAYDPLGRKAAEGDFIAEPVLPDTAYVENPEPPYDLQMTMITENGGKHGLWLFYDGEGNVTDTVNFEMGVAQWTGDIVGKWELDSISTTDTSSIGTTLFAVAMAMSDMKGYEFTTAGKLRSLDSSGAASDNGEFAWSKDRTTLYWWKGQEQESLYVRKLNNQILELKSDRPSTLFVKTHFTGL